MVTTARVTAVTARTCVQAANLLEDLVTRYRELATAGLAGSLYRQPATAKDARRIARRLLSFEDLILRFATRPDLDIFSSYLSTAHMARVDAGRTVTTCSW
jgi:hypothetical protein